MSAEAVGWVYRHSPYEGATFVVHLAMADSANDQHDYELWSADATTAAKARVSVGSVRRAHQQMRSDGFLELIDAPPGGTNRWRFLFPDVPIVFEYRARGERGMTDPAHGARTPARGELLKEREPKPTANAVPPASHTDVTPVPLLDVPTTPTGPVPVQLAGALVQHLVGSYVDDYRAVCNGHDPSRQWRAMAGREVRKALENGETPEHVAGCLQVIARERKSPAVLPHMIADSHAGIPRRQTR